MHSKKFEVVKKYYDGKFWGISKVRNAVENRWITKEEYKQITGKEYMNPEDKEDLSTRVKSLENQNQMLTECIMEMSEIVYA